MPPITTIRRLPEFERDMKSLTRRFRSLSDDLKILIDTQLRLLHELGIDNGGIKEITGVGTERARFYKVRKFACKSLKGKGSRSGLRLIYAYVEADERVDLIEIYYKGDQENEDRKRIASYDPG